MRTLFYAMGGGMGHIVRARALLHTLEYSDVVVLTSSPYASMLLPDVELLMVPPALARQPDEYAQWLTQTLTEVAPGQLILDVFPGGIIGEWTEALLTPWLDKGLSLILLARLLRWERYCQRATWLPPRFHKTYLLEALTPAHMAYVEEVSDERHPLQLIDPPALATNAPSADLVALAKGSWLVIHSGPLEEVEELILYTQERQQMSSTRAPIIVITQAPPSGALVEEVAAWCPLFSLVGLLDAAEMIVTAGGFNTMRELISYQQKHLPLPMTRRWDDQFARVARWREARTSPCKERL